MAKTFTSKIGCEEGKLFPLTEGTTSDTYGEPIDLAGLTSANLTISVAEASKFGDDVALDVLALFTSGTLAEQTAGEPETTVAILNGKTVDAETGEVTDSTNDTPPAFGHSFLARTRRKNPTTGAAEEGYTAYFYYKVKYAPIVDSITGKADNVTYSVSDLSATVLANGAGVWRKTASFYGATALADARAWVLEKAGLSE